MRRSYRCDVHLSPVVELYKRLQLEPEAREIVRKRLRVELERGSLEARKAQRDLALEKSRLDARSRKLLDAHLDGALPADLYKEEQQAISRQLAAIVERLENLTLRFDELERNLDGAIELAGSCYDAYRGAPDVLRRIYNQAFFTRILIWEEEPASGELQDLFELVLTTSAETTPPERQETENTGFSVSKGSKDEHLVPLEVCGFAT